MFSDIVQNARLGACESVCLIFYALVSTYPIFIRSFVCLLIHLPSPPVCRAIFACAPLVRFASTVAPPLSRAHRHSSPRASLARSRLVALARRPCSRSHCAATTGTSALLASNDDKVAQCFSRATMVGESARVCADSARPRRQRQRQWTQHWRSAY